MGSSFLLNVKNEVLKEQMEFMQSTPEYLPPEIQSYLNKRYSNERNVKVYDFAEVAYIFDMWALASILLEVLSGFPLWLSLKSRVITMKGNSIINYGLFGVSGRDNGKILTKQQQLFKGGVPQLLSYLTQGYDLTKS